MSASARDWLKVAEENAKAGEHLRSRERYRAAASRFYYAAYQAAHATLFATPVRTSAPPRGNWDHGPLINAVCDTAKRHLAYDDQKSEQLRRRLVAARDARVIADYGAGDEFELRSLDDAQRAATQFIALAYRQGANAR